MLFEVDENRWHIIEKNDTLDLPPLREKVLIEVWQEFKQNGKRIRLFAERVTSRKRKSEFVGLLYGNSLPAYKIYRWFSFEQTEND